MPQEITREQRSVVALLTWATRNLVAQEDSELDLEAIYTRYRTDLATEDQELLLNAEELVTSLVRIFPPHASIQQRLRDGFPRLAVYGVAWAPAMTASDDDEGSDGSLEEDELIEQLLALSSPERIAQWAGMTFVRRRGRQVEEDTICERYRSEWEPYESRLPLETAEDVIAGVLSAFPRAFRDITLQGTPIVRGIFWNEDLATEYDPGASPRADEDHSPEPTAGQPVAPPSQPKPNGVPGPNGVSRANGLPGPNGVSGANGVHSVKTAPERYLDFIKQGRKLRHCHEPRRSELWLRLAFRRQAACDTPRNVLTQLYDITFDHPSSTNGTGEVDPPLDPVKLCERVFKLFRTEETEEKPGWPLIKGITLRTPHVSAEQVFREEDERRQRYRLRQRATFRVRANDKTEDSPKKSPGRLTEQKSPMASQSGGRG